MNHSQPKLPWHILQGFPFTEKHVNWMYAVVNENKIHIKRKQEIKWLPLWFEIWNNRKIKHYYVWFSSIRNYGHLCFLVFFFFLIHGMKTITFLSIRWFFILQKVRHWATNFNINHGKSLIWKILNLAYHLKTASEPSLLQSIDLHTNPCMTKNFNLLQQL